MDIIRQKQAKSEDNEASTYSDSQEMYFQIQTEHENENCTKESRFFVLTNNQTKAFMSQS